MVTKDHAPLERKGNASHAGSVPGSKPAWDLGSPRFWHAARAVASYAARTALCRSSPLSQSKIWFQVGISRDALSFTARSPWKRPARLCLMPQKSGYTLQM